MKDGSRSRQYAGSGLSQPVFGYDFIQVSGREWLGILGPRLRSASGSDIFCKVSWTKLIGVMPAMSAPPKDIDCTPSTIARVPPMVTPNPPSGTWNNGGPAGDIFVKT